MKKRLVDMKRHTQLVKRLEEVFAKEGLSDEKAHEVAFHMLDWSGELEDLYDLYKNMEKKSDSEIDKIIVDFLIHVPQHVNAARFLYGLGEVQDVFELGIMKGDS